MDGAGEWSVEHGVFYRSGQPRILLCAEYPYFRDERDSWRDRLEALKASGCDVLTIYVPWRHHAPKDPLHGEGAYDFDGRTQPNRDLVGLLDLAQEMQLDVILKPGPFIHAELPFGGLPDYVCPDCGDSTVEAERDAHGDVMEWNPWPMRKSLRHTLPAPFGTTYLAYVRDWMRAIASQVLRRYVAPHGPVFALQLMNEGIYSDSAVADPRFMGFSSSTLERFRRFLRERYGSLESYNEAHNEDVRDWDAVEPPRRAEALGEPRDLQAYLDWSAFQARLYVDTARLYQGFLIDGGLPGRVPIVFNFNPNGNTYRQYPASNDGWYTRVNVLGARGFVFGSTNWVGVLCSDAAALRQYVMAVTAFRGPAMEQNWGFSTQYYQPYAFVTPSHFESMLSIACGATGSTVYTFAGAKAWRNDPNLFTPWLPPRTNDRRDASSMDYPGDAPVLSTGERTGKYWTIRQIAQWADAEGSRFIGIGPQAEVAWGIYPPYAWSGQWLRRGDPDDLIWRPPLRAVPRGAFHGLDAFVEMMLSHGVAFRQLDISREETDLDACHVLCLSSHEFMDEATQARLVRFVERGGRLLLTNIVPDKDEGMRPMRGPLASALFPHTDEAQIRLAGPRPLTLRGQQVGRAMEFAVGLEPPRDADLVVRLDERVVGYRRDHGKGRVLYLGVGPWRAALSNDDPVIAGHNQRLAWELIHLLSDRPVAPAEPVTEPGQVGVWRHACQEADEGALFVVVRDVQGRVEVVSRAPEGEHRILLDSPSQAVHAVGLTGGRIRSAYLKGINDLRGEAVAPRVQVGDERLWADDPCDLCVTRVDGALVVSVAHVAKARTRVHVPWHEAELPEARLQDGTLVEVAREPTGVAIVLEDVARVGTCRLALPARATRAAPAV